MRQLIVKGQVIYLIVGGMVIQDTVERSKSFYQTISVFHDIIYLRLTEGIIIRADIESPVKENLDKYAEH